MIPSISRILPTHAENVIHRICCCNCCNNIFLCYLFLLLVLCVGATYHPPSLPTYQGIPWVAYVGYIGCIHPIYTYLLHTQDIPYTVCNMVLARCNVFATGVTTYHTLCYVTRCVAENSRISLYPHIPLYTHVGSIYRLCTVYILVCTYPRYAVPTERSDLLYRMRSILCTRRDTQRVSSHMV